LRSHAFVEDVPVKGLAELGAVVGLDFLDLDRQLGQDVIDEPDPGLLIVRREGLQHPQAGAVIDSGVLVVALLLAGLAEGFDELHVDLEGVAWALLLVAVPSGLAAFVSLRRRESVQADLLQDPPDPGGADRDVVIPLQIHRDLLRAEVILLAQPEDLFHDLRVGRCRGVVRGAGAVLQPLEPFLLIAFQPAVIGLPAHAVVAAARGDVPADFLNMPQHRELVIRPPLDRPLSRSGECFCHAVFLPNGRPECQQPPSVL
jgi:hypothetical protein